MNIQPEKERIIAVIQLERLGDTLMTQSLCTNIKLAYPGVKLVYIIAKPFFEVAKRLKDVDEVFYFDKKYDHRGILGPWIFAKQFPYKGKIDTAIVTYRHERALLLSIAIKAKKRVCIPLKGPHPLNLFITHKRELDLDEQLNKYKAEYNADFLRCLGVTPKQFDVDYDVKDIEAEITDNFAKYIGSEPYIVLAPKSSNVWKDWDFENVADFVEKSPYNVVLTGTDDTKPYVDYLTEKGLAFINLVGKTSVNELAVILKKAKCSVCVDTGAMHLSYCVHTPTICLFFKKGTVNEWIPEGKNYIKVFEGCKIEAGKDKHIICEKDITSEEVLAYIKENLCVGEEDVKKV